MRFRCSRHRVGCRFSFKARMVLTNDYREDDFWTLENWEIIPNSYSKPHICNLVTTESTGSTKKILQTAQIFEENEHVITL